MFSPDNTDGQLQLRRTEFILKNLNKFRVRNVMLLCSLYDYYTVEEDGMLEDVLRVSNSAGDTGIIPAITQVSDATTALEMLGNTSGLKFDLIICMSTGENISFEEFTRKVHEIQPELNVAVLTHNLEELNGKGNKDPGTMSYRLFNWMGTGEIIQSIIQLTEDAENALHDCGKLNAPCLMLVEDDFLFYSRYLHQGRRKIQQKTFSRRTINENKEKTRRYNKKLAASSFR